MLPLSVLLVLRVLPRVLGLVRSILVLDYLEVGGSIPRLRRDVFDIECKVVRDTSQLEVLLLLLNDGNGRRCYDGSQGRG